MNPVLPGSICQIGYVVADLDDAISRWLQMGVVRGSSSAG